MKTITANPSILDLARDAAQGADMGLMFVVGAVILGAVLRLT